MKKVLYLTNIEVPYRVKFFNELAKYCDLTVLYEREQSKNRDEKWTNSEQAKYKSYYLSGFKILNENTFSLKFLKYIFSDYEIIVIGCYNSPIQILSILLMRLFNKDFYLNLDGEVFCEKKGIKNTVKKFVLKGAKKYLVAGEKAAESLKRVFPKAEVFPYYFSSLTKKELECRRSFIENTERGNTILVVGQYFDYKGLDIALDAAKMDPSIRYKFVGMGKRTKMFREECHTDELPNVELIPFLQKEELNKEYQQCAMLVLPSRQECWGLVINEAASFGTPIVSTWGSGAAVEFLSEEYPQYLTEANAPSNLLECIRCLKSSNSVEKYSDYLKKVSRNYSIERCVQEHLKAFEIEV